MKQEFFAVMGPDGKTWGLGLHEISAKKEALGLIRHDHSRPLVDWRHLADEGYSVVPVTIAGPGEVVIPVDVVESAVQELMDAITIMDEKGRGNAEGNSTMLWDNYWDMVRLDITQSLEKLKEHTS
jgi:hypothetical protein